MDETLIIKAGDAMAKLNGHGPTKEVYQLIEITMTVIEARADGVLATPEQVREALLGYRVEVSLEAIRKGLWLIRNI